MRSTSSPAPNVVGGTPLQRFERKLIGDARLNAKGRGILQMMLLSSKQAFTMRLDVQAQQLNASIAVVYALRRLAVQTGLFEETPKGYERVKLPPPGASFSERFRACESIDLTIRLAATVLAIANGSPDGWARPSINKLAAQLRARPERTSVRVQVLLQTGLFEVERRSGLPNAYRPAALEEQQTSARRTIKKLKTSSAPTVDEVVSGLFNGSRVLADSFRSDVLARAKRLRLGDEAVVAARLADLYRAIRAARPGGPTPEGMLGPLTLLERYVGWLEEQDWVRAATTRVLKFDSRAFSQFRTEQATRYGVCDPVTGDRAPY